MNQLIWGTKSSHELTTIHTDLYMVLNKALQIGIIDMTVLQGRRGRQEQDHYCANGRSEVWWPDSKHNVLHEDDLSDAVDVAPHIKGIGVSYDKHHCCVMAGVILTCAKLLKIPIRWGGNWDMDREPITDQDFQDLVHFERIRRIHERR